MVRGSNPGRGEIFRTRTARPWGPPILLYNGYGVMPEGKAARAWRSSPTPSSSDVKERVELYLYSPSGPSWPVLRWTLHFTFIWTIFSHNDRYYQLRKYWSFLLNHPVCVCPHPTHTNTHILYLDMCPIPNFVKIRPATHLRLPPNHYVP